MALIAVLILLATSACSDESAAVQSAAEQSATTRPEAERMTEGGCIESAELVGALYGSLEADIRWRGDALSCEGMPRPEGAGARMRFAASLEKSEESQTLAFIIALPELKRGETAKETPARVTLIQENSGRFFSTGEADVCWSDVTRQEQIAGTQYAVEGIVYCVSPLAELNGTGGVSFTELRYAGALDWSGD